MIASYASVDPVITRWIQKHSLILSTEWAGGETRNVYVSSHAGECFQIWIDQPVGDRVGLHAAHVDGPRDIEPAKDWIVAISDLNSVLEEAFDTVLKWMEPSKRYNPESF
jgi:hypothetical protein